MGSGAIRRGHKTQQNPLSRKKHVAANWVALGILYNSGQDCTAGSRLFVQDTIYDKFIPVRATRA